MTRTKIKDRVLPEYTKGEEIFNMTSHIVGAVLGIVSLVLCVVFSSIHKNGYAIVSSVIYGVNMILLYSMSSIYHGLSRKTTAKKIFQVFDHCSIYLQIAGSYTPFCLVTFLNYDKALGWGMFAVIWIFALIGILLNAIDIKKYKVISMICYLVMGWCIIFKINLLPVLLEKNAIILLLLGGIAYTIGAVLYGVGKKVKYMHSVFHLFIVLGSLLQFLCILLYVV